ncbi:MAG: hypothetical protein AAF460_16190, partial [Pseudomonadota bacterium]
MAGRRFGPIVYTVLCGLVLFVGTARAEGTVPGLPAAEAETVRDGIALGAPESKAAVRDMVSRLDDDAVRQLLIERLDAVAELNASAPETRTAMQALTDGLRVYVDNARSNLTNLDRVPDFLSRFRAALQQAVSDFGTGTWWAALVAFLVLGVVAQRGVERLFRRKRAALMEELGYTLWAVLRIVYSRLAIDALGVVAFFLVAYLGFSMFVPWPGVAHQLGYAIIVTFGAWWLGSVFCHFVFAPGKTGLRFCSTDDERAFPITRDFALLAGYVVALHNIYYLFQTIGFDELGGVDNLAPFGFLMNMSLYAMVALAIWRHRATLTDVLNNNQKRNARLIDGEEDAPDSVFAGNWPKIALVLILVKYLFVEIILNATDLAVYSTSAVYMTFFVIALWPALDGNVTLFVAMGTRAAEDESPAAAKARVQMQRGLLRVGRVFVVGVVLYLLAKFWSFDVVSMAESGFGVQTAGNLYELLFALLIGYTIWEVITISARRVMAAETGGVDGALDDGGGDMGGVGLSRTATLVPIFEVTAKALVVLVAVLVALDGLGINITPLLAGSAVVGLAVGFGAQTLVKDIVSGLFFLADDAFRVAEYIEIGDT